MLFQASCTALLLTCSASFPAEPRPLPMPTCALCQGLAAGKAQPQGAVVSKVSQHVQGWLHFIWLVHGTDVVGEDVADLAGSCHRALCRETTVSRGPAKARGTRTQAPGTAGARLGEAELSPSLRPSSPLRSLVQKLPPSTYQGRGLTHHQPGAGSKGG